MQKEIELESLWTQRNPTAMLTIRPNPCAIAFSPAFDPSHHESGQKVAYIVQSILVLSSARLASWSAWVNLSFINLIWVACPWSRPSTVYDSHNPHSSRSYPGHLGPQSRVSSPPCYVRTCQKRTASPSWSPWAPEGV